MEITVQNYRQLRNSFDTSKLNKDTLEVFNDVDTDFEDYLDLYTDASPENDGIRDVINNHIKLVNKYLVNSPKETAASKLETAVKKDFGNNPNVSFGSVPKYDFLEPEKEYIELFKGVKRDSKGHYIPSASNAEDYYIKKAKEKGYKMVITDTKNDLTDLYDLYFTIEKIQSKPKTPANKKIIPFAESKYFSKYDVYTRSYNSDFDLQFYSFDDGSISEIKSEREFLFRKKENGLILKIKEGNKTPSSHSKTKEPDKAPAKSKAAPKNKTIKPTISKKFVDNFSIEFQLIRRFWNMVDDGVKVVPFRKVQLLFNAFNKAALERKIRKTNDVADLFTKCSDKIVKLYLEFAKPNKSDVEVDLIDKTLYNDIKKYCTNVAINPAVSVLKRYISVQNTKPDIKKVALIIKAIDKVLDNDANNRLAKELQLAKENLVEYLENPTDWIDVEQFGLSRPASQKVCHNRVKCTGLTPNGQLKKGYRFEEDSNNVIKVVKGLGSPAVCHNRVKCAGLTKDGKLRPGYKFREDTNEVIRVSKAKPTAKRKAPIKKKRVVGLGFSENDDVEHIYVHDPVFLVNNNFDKSTLYEKPIVQEQQVVKQLAAPAIEVEKPLAKNKLMQMQFESLQMDEGWENFMQDPAKNMRLAIWGKPKNGKTAGSLQMANYLTKFGNVLYNFVDQGFNKSTQDLWLSSGLANNNKAVPTDVQTLDELEKEIKTGKYTFVFIDMISDYINREGIKPYEFKERFIKKYPKVSFILIFEVTKSGDFKGDQGWTHIVDAIVTVEDFCMENRGRYGMGHHIIWEEGLKKFNPKKYAEIQETQFANVEHI